MENKKLEKKSVLKKLTIGIAAMALISCAFVGGTFARYTTGEKEIPGGVNVADWKIEVIEDAADIFEFTPNKEAYSNQIRKKTVSEGGKILEIKNSGKVAATVTIEVDTSSYVMEDKEGNPAQFPQYSVVDGEAVNAAWENVTSVADIFTLGALTVQYSGSTSAATGDTQGSVTTYEITLEAGESVIVSIGEVVWTSDLSGENGVNGDVRDTWIGENISQIGYKMTWSAVQAEEIPVN